MNPYNIAEQNACHYSGDINVEYGGVFYEIENWKDYGYSTAVRITDLDSGCGFSGAILIESITINKPDDMSGALSCYGYDAEEAEEDIHMQIEACLGYGHYDPDIYNTAEALQTEEDGPMVFDGWKAAKRVLTKDLLGYIQSKYLKEVF